MAQYEGSYPQRGASQAGSVRKPSGWAIGFIFFAAIMMMLVGMFHFFEGLAAVLNSDFFIVRPHSNLQVNVQTWGWLHMAGGVIIGLAGAVLVTGATWARIVGIALAVVSGVWSFLSIPYYPVWALLIISLDIGIIWALTAHGRALAE